MRPACLAALLLAAAPAAAEDRWIALMAEAEAYIGLSPYRPDFAVYFERDGTTWRDLVWNADNMTVAELGALGCVAARDPVRGTVRGDACPANVWVSVLQRDDGSLTVELERVAAVGRPGGRFGP